MTWNTEIEPLDTGPGCRYRMLRDGGVATWREVIAGWGRDAAFTDLFLSLLARASFEAFYFETPPISRRTDQRPFEFVLIDSPLLAGFRPEPGVFAEHYRSPAARDGVTAFENLGRDALLVAPCPGDPAGDYAHLAAFARQAPRALQRALWRRVAEAADEWLAGAEPVWISTAGQGVAWLHVRLDRFPKYYNHVPYRVEPA